MPKLGYADEAVMWEAQPALDARLAMIAFPRS
jgi:hypothetical protein